MTPTPPVVPTATFDFQDGTDGWQYRYTNAFDVPTSSSSNGILTITGSGNSNDFGYWESPLFETDSSNLERSPSTGGRYDVLAFGTDLGPASLYSAQFLVRSTVADPARVPQFRLRATMANLVQANFLVVDSRGNGAYSPGSEGRTYELLFAPPLGVTRFQLAFDMLNFEPTDDPRGDLQLDSVVVTRRNIAEFDSARTDATYTFQGSTEGWQPVEVAGFTAPKFTAPDSESAGLAISPNRKSNVFGYWASPGVVTVESGRTYAAVFTVGSDVAPENQPFVPQFRVRLNESGFHAAVVQAVESAGPGLRSPVAGADQVYVVFLKPSPAAAGTPLLAAFDLLNLGFDDDTFATLVMRKLVIQSVADSAPVRP